MGVPDSSVTDTNRNQPRFRLRACRSCEFDYIIARRKGRKHRIEAQHQPAVHLALRERDRNSHGLAIAAQQSGFTPVQRAGERPFHVDAFGAAEIKTRDRQQG